MSRRKHTVPAADWADALRAQDLDTLLADQRAWARHRQLNGPPLAPEHRAAHAHCPCGWCEP